MLLPVSRKVNSPPSPCFAVQILKCFTRQRGDVVSVLHMAERSCRGCWKIHGNLLAWRVLVVLLQDFT